MTTNLMDKDENFTIINKHMKLTKLDETTVRYIYTYDDSKSDNNTEIDCIIRIEHE